MSLKHQNAFTLIELLTVVGVLSVLALMALPQYANIKKGVILGGEAQRAMDALRIAQSRALTAQGGADHTVLFEDQQFTLDGVTVYRFESGVHTLSSPLPVSVTFERLSGKKIAGPPTINIGYPGGAYKEIQIAALGTISINN